MSDMIKIIQERGDQVPSEVKVDLLGAVPEQVLNLPTISQSPDGNLRVESSELSNFVPRHITDVGTQRLGALPHQPDVEYRVK